MLRTILSRMIRLGAIRQTPIGKETEIVIEGFPRSGNTFALLAFETAQPRPVAIAHHSHAPAQVIRAVRRGIPTLILIRRPADAVLSWVIRDRHISVRQALRRYIGLYSRVMLHRDGYVVELFEEVTSDFGELISRINERFGTSFSPFVHSEENV